MSFTTCKKEEDQSGDGVYYGYDYFPFSPQAPENIYKITEINIDAAAGVYDTIIFYVKQVEADTFTDDEGRAAIKLLRYYSDSLQDTLWKLKDVWWIAKTDFEIIEYEENKPFVKLSFPIEKNKQWDGNKYNADEPQMYCVTVFQGDSVVVMQRNELTEISKNYEYEVYKKNVGLVKKVYEAIKSYHDIGTGVPIENRIDYATLIYWEKVDE
jgi:hypothetical protein